MTLGSGQNRTIRTYSDPRDEGRDGFEVVERGGGVADNEVDCDKETTEDDGEAAADDGEHDVLLQQQPVPRGPPAAVTPASSC